MTINNIQPAPAGWYPDETHGNALRWWDGTQWTNAFAQLGNTGTPYTVRVAPSYKTNHILHLLLTIFTLGFWAPVWFIVAMVNIGRRDRASRS